MTPGQYASDHQKAFRTAFDFLNSHFPPGNSPEWWDQAAKDVSAASVRAGEGTLVIGLLNGVYDYLGEEYKRRNGSAETDS